MARPRSQPFSGYLNTQADRLLAQVPSRHARHQLAGFLGHACMTGKQLDALTDEDLGAFEAELATTGTKRPKQAARDAANAWNQMVGVPGWPTHKISPKDNARTRVFAFSALPAPLQHDIAAYLRKGDEDDLFSDSRSKPLSPATVRDRRCKSCQLVTIAVACGTPLPAIKSLRDLTSESSVRAILTELWKTNGKSRNGHGANLARLLRLIAMKHTSAPQKIVDLIKTVEGKLRPLKQGLTDGNRAKLRQIIQPENLKRLIQIPERFIAEIDRDKPTLSDALDLQSTIGVAILLNAPMREKNLAQLDFKAHFDLVGRRECHIVIPSEDVKNDVTLNYVFGPAFVRLFQLYWRTYRPLLLKGKDTSAVFISRTGRMKTPAELGAQIPKFIKERTGLVINLHLFRHLAGYLFLKAHPGEYEPVRQLLGHKSTATTLNFYLGLEEEDAFRRYDAVIDAYRWEDGDNVWP